MVIATNLTSVCSIYKKKIVKNVSYQTTNYSDIKPTIIKKFSTDSYIVDISWYISYFLWLILKPFIPVSRIFYKKEEIFIFSSESQINKYIARVHKMYLQNLFLNVMRLCFSLVRTKRTLLRCSQLQRVEYDLWKYIQMSL